MPDLKERADRERALVAALILLFRDYEEQEPATINWEDFRIDLEAAIRPQLAGTYDLAFTRLRSQIANDLDADPRLLSARWSEGYCEELAKQIIDNTRKLADAGEDLDDQFDVERAEKIAITETTRANTAGEFGVVSSMVLAGMLGPEEVNWITAQDDLVCEECEPLDGQPQDVWSLDFPAGPPAHPRCRCWLDYLGSVMESFKEQQITILDVPDVRQPDHWSCGAAAAMSVGRYFGVGPDDIEAWKKAVGTTGEKSTSAKAIETYLTRLGLQVTAAPNQTITDLSRSIAAGRPVICPAQDYGGGHWLRVIGMLPGYVICQDSSIENVENVPGGSVPKGEAKGTGNIAAPGKVLIRWKDWLANWRDKGADETVYLRFGISVGKP
jgi:hypothetical protein